MVDWGKAYHPMLTIPHFSPAFPLVLVAMGLMLLLTCMAYR